MAQRVNEPSLGALFFEGAGFFCIGALSMVLCVALAFIEFFKLIFWWRR